MLIMKNERVILMIPTYNEAEVIEDTLVAIAEVRSHLADFNLEVLVFDSASTDATSLIVANLQARYDWLHLQTEPQKSGLGSAYRQAMHYALTRLFADIVIEFDADLSHQPKYLIPMLDKIKTHDVVLGSRYVKNGKIPDDWGWQRRLLSTFGNQVARWLLTRRYKDFTSGFRVTRATILEPVLHQKFLSNHYAYKLQLLWLLHKQQANIFEFPIVFVDRQKGKSKLPSNSIIDSMRVLFILRYYELKDWFISYKYSLRR